MDRAFPYEVFSRAGYEVAHVGYSQWNGVAIISRVGIAEIADHFSGQPGFDKDQERDQRREARAVGATCGPVRVWSLYVPNGRQIADRHYEYKLQWLWELRRRVADELRRDPHQALLLAGDFNIAPRDEDVWDMGYFANATHVTEPERAVFDALLETGLREVTRQFTDKTRFTYWDYTQGRFPKNEGMRIDFQLASPRLADAARGGFIDTDERGGRGSSDHAPVIVDYDVDSLPPAPSRAPRDTPEPDFDSVR